MTTPSIRTFKPTRSSSLRKLSPFATALALGAVVVACADGAGEETADTGAQAQSVKSEGGKVAYVDTHDAYAHTGKVDPAKFNYFRKVDGKPSISLTFDCAWVAEANGMKIIDFLKSRGIRTTFFISGPFVFKDIKKGLAGGLNTASFKMIRRLVEDGHEFGNHTQTHPHNNSSINWVKENEELRVGWDAAVKQIFGSAVPPNAKMLPIWRAPFGEYDDRSLRQASKAGYPLHFGWNVDVLDAAGLPACKVDPSHPRCLSPGKMTQRIVDWGNANAWNFNGMVVLAHLQNPFDWSGSADGLAKLVDTYRGKGVAFRKVSEIFNRSLAPDVKLDGGASAPVPVPTPTATPSLPAVNGEAMITQDTWLKISATDSSTLSDAQKCRLPAGTVLAYSTRATEGAHSRLNLTSADGPCAWFPTRNVYLFSGHVTFSVR